MDHGVISWLVTLKKRHSETPPTLTQADGQQKPGVGVVSPNVNTRRGKSEGRASNMGTVCLPGMMGEILHCQGQNHFSLCGFTHHY